MRWRTTLMLLGLVAAALLVWTGCRRLNTRPATDEVRIGVVLSLSGSLSPVGRDCLNGLELAVEQQNQTAPRKVKLIVLDDKGDSIETANSMTQLIEVQKVSGLIGTVASTNTLAAAKVAQESRVPLLVPVSTNPAITKTGDYITRVCFNDAFQGRAMASFARNQLHLSRAAIVTDKSSDYSLGLAQSFHGAFTALGGQVVGEVSYTTGDSDYSAVVAAVKSAGPDVIFIPGYFVEVGAMLKQSAGSWDGITKLGGDGWENPKLIELAGPTVYGSFMCSHFAVEDATNPTAQRFVAEYRKKYGTVPGATPCLGYDTGLVLCDAVRRVQGPVTPEKLNAAIRSTQGLAGASGTIGFTAEREVTTDAVILEITRDGFKLKSRVSGN